MSSRFFDTLTRRLSAPTASVFWQLVRYALSGGLAFAVDFGLLYLFTSVFGCHYLVGAAVGYTAGLIITYLLSIRWIFDFRRLRSHWAEFLVFTAIGLAGLLLTQGLMYVFTDLWLGQEYYLYAKIITTVIVSLFNFTLKKLLLFNK